MCTSVRFADKDGNMLFGRNLDWSCSYGEQVVVTPRGYRRAWAFDSAGGPCSHAVIGMGIVSQGIPLYFDCANEAGLAVAGLNFPGFARYEVGPVSGKISVAAYEFPLWLTSRFETVDEVESALADLALVARPVNDAYPVSFLHWMVADAQRSVVVEYGEGGMRVLRNDADVLANQPGFAWHRENLRNYLALTSHFPESQQWGAARLEPYGSGFGMHGLPGDYSSPSRFVRAAYLNAHYPVQDGERANVLRLFHTLGGVSMVEGAAQMEGGPFEKTVYTGGYSASSRTYYFNKYEDPAIRCVSLADVDVTGSELLTPEPKLWPASA